MSISDMLPVFVTIAVCGVIGFAAIAWGGGVMLAPLWVIVVIFAVLGSILGAAYLGDVAGGGWVGMWIGAGFGVIVDVVLGIAHFKREMKRDRQLAADRTRSSRSGW